MLRYTLMPFLLLISIQCLAKAVDVNVKTKERSDLFVEGTHYQLLANPLPVDPSAPVMEFMYYGCETCFKLAPVIAEWSYTKKIGVSLVPTHSETAMVDAAQLFHTFEVMGVLDSMYEEGFILFQTKESKLEGADRINEALSRHSIDKNQFWDIWKSDAVNKRLIASGQLTRQAQVFKTPTFLVQGIYKVDIQSLKNIEELFLLLEYLTTKKLVHVPALLKKQIKR